MTRPASISQNWLPSDLLPNESLPNEPLPNEPLPNILGYTLGEQLYLGSRTAVYRAVQTAQGSPVIIKVLRREYPSFSELVQFRNQYTMTNHLAIPGIVRPLGLEPVGRGYALVMADSGDLSLDQYIQQARLELVDVLAIALQIADILHNLCQHQIVHKDIKPANILIHPQSKQIQLIDFSIASLLPKETLEIHNPNILEGTLAYLAPEQTGRMNRGIDYRTDFYAFGITLYQLLTGQLPFTAADPLELVHCHIAQQPTPADQVNPAVPAMVSAIVAKLMAKNAEDRYQSALGLKYDLQLCLNHWNTTGAIPEFSLGQRDISDRFTIPEKLYGRESEVQTLLDAFDRVASPSEQQEGQGRSELMLVAGFSGIGKTAVIHEVHKPIVKQRGYFIKGKFDQFNRNIPFSAFVQAFRDLVTQLLSESDSQLQTWKTQILQALGENAQVIVDLIPELERIIGSQPPAPALSGTAAQNRFNLLFQRFIQVFTTAEHPLVIFVDDLQWADSASLNLIQVLMAEAKTGYLLLLGAYRDNEVFPAHPLMLTLESLAKAGANLNTITLKPLTTDSLNPLIADTLRTTEALAQPLTELVFQKTQGNPFFATQFLKVLHHDQLITFDRTAGHWQCDIVQVRDSTLTDDVVEFMALQLQKLPQSTQDILKLAACIGAQFDLDTLAIVSEQSQTEVATALWPALQEGLILPQSEIYKFFLGEVDQQSQQTQQSQETLSYRFLHDRVQQAAYSLIPLAQKQITHLKIGQLLFSNTPESQREARIFNIVNQFNIGIDLIDDSAERLQLAQLNLIAGQKAKVATAYGAAVNYFSTGLTLLGHQSWQDHYNLTLKLHELLAESEYLNTHFETSETLIQAALSNTQKPLDKVKFYEIRIQSYTAQNRLLEAIAAGRQALELVGIDFPQDCDFPTTLAHHEQLKIRLGDRAIESFVDLPSLADPEQDAAMRILVGLFASIYLAQPSLLPLKIFTMVEICIESGNSPQAAIAYSLYALFLCATGDIERGYQFGQLATAVLEKFQAKELTSKVNLLFGLFVKHWKTSIRSTLPVFLAGLTSGLEQGDLEYVGYCANCYAQFLFWSGENLATAESEAAKYCQLIQSIKQEASLIWATTWQQTVVNLREQSKQPTQLVGEWFDESTTLPALIESRNVNGICYVYLAKLLLSYLFGDYPAAQEYAQHFETYEQGAAGLLIVPLKNFYQSLSLLAAAGNSEPELDAIALEKVQENQRCMQAWADSAPMNYLHKFQLVEAERYRVLGQPYEASDWYDRAIAGAKANGYLQEAAIANELAAKFYLAWGKDKVAAGYLQEAYYDYTYWGSAAKVDDLTTRYPQLLAPILQPPAQSRDVLSTLRTITAPKSMPLQSVQASQHETSSSTSINQALDFAAILKASQILSSTIQLDELLRQLTKIILQNSGGDRCALILPDHNNQWQVVAIATPETIELRSEPLENTLDVPIKLIHYVQHTAETVVIDDLKTDLPVMDEYLQQRQPKSLLCLPILHQGQLIGILYLKNRGTSGAFTHDRIVVLNFLCTQAAISLENARLYAIEQAKSLQLQVSELRLKTIFEKATDAILLLNPSGFIDCNQAALDLFDYREKSQLLHLSVSALSPALQPDGSPSSEKEAVIIAQALETGNLCFEWLHQRSNGHTFFAEVTLTAIPYDDETILHCLVRDISDRKKLESEQQRFIKILDTTPDFVGLASAQGRILWHNKKFCEFRPDLLDPNHPKHISECHPQWVNQMIREQGLPTAIQEGSWSGEVALLDANQQEVPVSQVIIAHKSESGEVENFSTIMRDISDRKAAEAASKAFQEKLTFLIQKTPIGIIEWNTEFQVASWNPAAEKIFGYTATEMAGHHASRIVPDVERSHVDRIMQALLGQEGGFYSLNKNLRKDGTLITCEWINTPLKDSQGNAVGVFSMVQDVSDRIAAEATIRQKSEALEQTLQELQNTQLQMVQSEKMASLGNLVAGIAHEINNPIGFLNGSINNGTDYLRDLLEHLALYQQHYPNPVSNIQDHADRVDLEFLTEDFAKLLRSMRGAADRIKNISTSLRTFSRSDREHKVKANLQEGMESTILILKYRLKANEHRPAIQVIQDYADLPDVDCFPGQLNQVFMNILANAIDMFDEIAQQTAYRDLELNPQQITIQTEIQAANQVAIRIRDNGKGMSQEVQARIFDHLFTTKGVGKGTGLGLAISRQIVEETHGGTITVNSTVGQGTEFTISLPIERSSIAVG
ncbi:AAA family ATPase [Alkalinema sp. FACHB-956]|uniref:PAS domain S-box protein n=1 Tax=Alkalinema sp. FACHB-956 TaxID=2692768 RepID=UPI001685FBD5|nr:AAA family ATPase [Alkalinema sp. FACHB-956]MBD2329606.1 AAA family ATPase [Alkalinema sp. FACHB-956]